MRAIKGQLNYREFLGKFQNKSLGSLTARAAMDPTHPYVFCANPIVIFTIF